MRTIRFSHDYPKLHGQTSGELLAVRPIDIDARTPKELLDYDTAYVGGRYPLRHGRYIQLIFLGNLRIPFCTIRSAWPKSKVAYYESAVGETFSVETPGGRSCDTCRCFCGFRQQEIDFDTGETMVVVSCTAHAFATPDYADVCSHYRRKEVAQ